MKLTRRYSIKNSKKVYRKIDFDLFYEELLSALALLVYPRLGTQEALERLFSEYIYPNLVTNLPYLGKRDKVIREKRSNSMLNLGGMLLL